MRRMIMTLCWLYLLAGPGVAGLVPRTVNDPDFVRLGNRQGFYRLSSDSGKWWDWGFSRAPVDEPTMFNHGNGTDAIAIPFDSAGRVTFAPLYIYTIRPDSYEERKLSTLVQGVTTQAEVRQIYGNPMRAKVRGYEVWYYEIKVYNPFEEPPGRDFR